MAFFPKRPALRIVNSVGSVISGPLKLWLPDSANQGIVLGSTRIEYAPELLGPYQNTSYQERWRLLGYRPVVELSFPVVMADGASGAGVLLSYYAGSLVSETYAALQFNLYHDTCNVWRGVYPTSSWAPRLLRGKERLGYEVDMTLRARDLITTVGDWSAGTW